MSEKIVNYNDITKVKDLVTLNLLKENFNKDYEKQKKVVETLELAKEMKGKKFGYIKESFENFAPELFKTKEGRVIIGKYITAIKESEDIKKMHVLYECIRKASGDIDTTAYINEAVSMIGRISKKDYLSATQKLGSILGEACIKLGKDRADALNAGLSSDLNKLNEAVEYVCLNKKTPKTLLEYTTSCDVIKEHIKQHGSNVSSGAPQTIDIDKSIDDFNKKYGVELSENEQLLVKELMENSDKEVVFNKYKKNCMAKLCERRDAFKNGGDAMSVDRMNVILEKVERKRFDPETVNTDVFNLFEMTNSME